MIDGFQNTLSVLLTLNDKWEDTFYDVSFNSWSV